MVGLAPAEGEGCPRGQRQSDPGLGTTSSTRTGTLFEHYGTQATPENLGDREAVIILDLSAWSQLGEVAEFVRGFAGPRARRRPSRQPGRPRARPTSRTPRPRPPARWSSGRRMPWACPADARDGHRPADGDRHGHRLVPPPQHPKPDTLLTAAELIDVGGEDRGDLSSPVRAEHPGPAQDAGRVARQPPDRPGRADRLRHRHPRRLREDRRRPPGHRRPRRLHRQRRRRRGRPPLHRAGPRAASSSAPGRERASTAPGCLGQFGGGRPQGRRRRHPARPALRTSARASSRPSARP